MPWRKISWQNFRTHAWRGSAPRDLLVAERGLLLEQVGGHRAFDLRGGLAVARGLVEDRGPPGHEDALLLRLHPPPQHPVRDLNHSLLGLRGL